LEASTVEITIRNGDGELVVDGGSTTALQWPNSTQSHWIELPARYDRYIVEAAVFKAGSGLVLYDTRDEVTEHGPTTFTIGPLAPVFLSIIVVDCEKLRQRATQRPG
jgi:hypothetical protein